MNLDWTVSTHADVSIPDTDPIVPIVGYTHHYNQDLGSSHSKTPDSYLDT